MEPEYYYELPQETIKEDAPFSRRAGAFIIDMIVFYFLLYAPFISVFQEVSGIKDELITADYLLSHPQITASLAAASLSSLVIFCFYLSLMEYAAGATVGEQLMGLSVTQAKIWDLVARNLTKSILIALLPLDLLGLPVYKQKFIDHYLRIKVIYEGGISLII